MTYTSYTYTSARGNLITVRRPELTEEEKAQRMAAIKKATIELVIASDRAKPKKLHF